MAAAQCGGSEYVPSLTELDPSETDICAVCLTESTIILNTHTCACRDQSWTACALPGMWCSVVHGLFHTCTAMTMVLRAIKAAITNVEANPSGVFDCMCIVPSPMVSQHKHVQAPWPAQACTCIHGQTAGADRVGLHTAGSALHRLELKQMFKEHKTA